MVISMNQVSMLKKSQLFHGVSEEELASLVKCLGCSYKDYKKGETIYHAGDFVHEIGVIMNGSIHIIKDDAWGNSNIIAEIITGEMFAESIVCSGVNVLPVTVTAADDTLVCIINFQRIIMTCSSVCVFHTMLIRNMIGMFARKNIMLAEKMEHITKRTTREKLLSYLSEQSKLKGSTGFEIPFDRQGLADYLSVERSALSAEMSRLKAAGIINYRKNHFSLLG